MQDQVMPADKWQFDDEVTQVFDDMLRRSIPQYEVMRKAVFDLACGFVKSGLDVVDLGCSRGEAIASLVEHFGGYCRYVGVEVSPPMLAAVRERFKAEIARELVRIEELDLRERYPACSSCVTLSVLTLMFVPINYRQRVVQQIYDHTADGGALILVEKVLGSTANLDSIEVAIYHEMKQQHGYSQDAIERKRLSLEGVLVPVTAKWDEELLRMAGFRQVDCFWRWMNFAGWVAIK